MLRFLSLVFLAGLALATAHAQTVHWENSESGDPAELQLVFRDCAPDGDIRLPATPGVTLAQVGTSSQTSIVNFSISRSVVVTYNARAQKPGSAVRIPEFTVQTNRGPVKVAAFTGGAARQAADGSVSARLSVGSTSVWAGEVFPLTYQLDASRRNTSQIVSNLDWNSAPLVTEDWSKPEPTESIVNGEPRSGMVYRARAYAKTPGQLVLNPASVLVNVQTGSIGFGIFQAPRMEQLNVVSDRPEILVRALPPSAPAGFSGAVGQFKFTSKVVPTSAGLGEPITWTVELSGTGNWPDIAGLPQRDVSRDFQVIQPQSKRTPTDGKLFDVTLTEDVVLIPTHVGSYTLGPLSFTYFDPKSGAYKTITTPATSVTITPPAGTPTAPAPATAPATPAEIENPKSRMENPPALPAGLPRDPLAGAARAVVPLPLRTTALLVAAPLLLPLFLWLWFALRRARATDPLRPQREARLRLTATLAELKSAAASQRPALLLRWQHDSALLWQLSLAAPPAAALADPAWSTLWSESDRALYSADSALPPDWLPRAEAALEAKRLKSFSPLRLFLPRNLLPFFFALAVLVVFVPRAAADDLSNYRAGNFAGAEKSWREALAAQPTDAIAHHNLSLALAQQDRWGEAAAHAAAAFVQHPSAEPVRWQLALACEKAGYVPAPLAGFLPPGPVQSLARLASPASWQLALACASLLFCAGLSLLLVIAYGRRSRPILTLALLCLVGGLLLCAASAASLHVYGDTADRRAVIVWREGLLRSIPTEADTTQKTTALAPGSLALVSKTFLSDRWLRLEFSNGQTGWVRREEVVFLWR